MLPIIISLVCGFIVGYKIYTLYINHTLNYHGPDSNIVKHTIYQDDNGKCYQFVPEVCICPL